MKIEIGTAYYPEAWPEERVRLDAKLMKEGGISLVRIGEFAWSHLEPREGVYTFDWLHSAVKILGRAGIKVILATPTSTAPAWLVKKHPEILIRHPDGTTAYFGVRDHTCYTSSVYRKYAAKLISRLAKEFGSYENIAAWQLDNEIGHTIFGSCHCGECQKEFRNFLRRKYGTLEKLNSAWWTVFWSEEYSDWDEIELGGMELKMDSARVLDSFRFRSEANRGFIANQVQAIRKYAPDAKICTNNYAGLFDRYKAAEMLDFMGEDFYPSVDYPMGYNAMVLDRYRGLKEGVPAWILESATSPGAPMRNLFRFFLWSFIARGYDHIVYFHWRSHLGGYEKSHGTFLGATGKPRARYRLLQESTRELDAVFKKYPSLPLPKSEAAVFLDYETLWGWCAGFWSHWTEYEKTVEFSHRQLLACGVNSDLISPDRDFNQYKLLVIPLQIHFSRELAQRLRDFIARGGVVLLGGSSGIYDGNSKLLPEPGPEHLRDVFGISIEDYIVFNSDMRMAKNEAREVSLSKQVTFSGTLNRKPVTGLADKWIADTELAGASVLLSYENTILKGQPFFTENKYGMGRALYYGANLVDETSLLAMTRYAVEKAGISCRDWPENVEAVTRGPLTFYLNHGDVPVSFKLDRKGAVVAGGRLVRGRLELPARDFCVIEHE